MVTVAFSGCRHQYVWVKDIYIIPKCLVTNTEAYGVLSFSSAWPPFVVCIVLQIIMFIKPEEDSCKGKLFPNWALSCSTKRSLNLEGGDVHRLVKLVVLPLWENSLNGWKDLQCKTQRPTDINPHLSSLTGNLVHPNSEFNSG